MFKWFTNMFYKKECYKCETLIDKIECIREHLLISPYSKEYVGLKIRFINTNVMASIDELKTLKDSIGRNDYKVKKITENNVEFISINKWFTDDEFNILNDTEVIWKEYMDLNIWLIKWFNEHNVVSKGREYGVSLKLKPYILNIEDVVDTLIEYQKQEI